MYGIFIYLTLFLKSVCSSLQTNKKENMKKETKGNFHVKTLKTIYLSKPCGNVTSL